MRTKRKKINNNNKIHHLDETSSLNEYYTCHFCNKKYKVKGSLVKHVRLCVGDDRFQTLTCDWCNLKFRNKGNLIQHYNIHGDSSLKVPNHLKQFQCRACLKLYSDGFSLKCHQRRDHYNLSCRRIPVYEGKNINDLWFETVLNSSKLLRIKKVGDSTLLMTSVINAHDIKAVTPCIEIDNLEHLYPMGKQKILVPCKICGKEYVKRNLKKHINENHYNIRRFKCSNCNSSYKRSYQFLRHVCSKASRRAVRGVKQVNSNIKITSVESLARPH